MSNYRELYLKLFNDITDIIEKLEQIQKEAEELFISQECSASDED